MPVPAQPGAGGAVPDAGRVRIAPVTSRESQGDHQANSPSPCAPIMQIAVLRRANGGIASQASLTNTGDPGDGQAIRSSSTRRPESGMSRGGGCEPFRGRASLEIPRPAAINPRVHARPSWSNLDGTRVRNEPDRDATEGWVLARDAATEAGNTQLAKPAPNGSIFFQVWI